MKHFIIILLTIAAAITVTSDLEANELFWTEALPVARLQSAEADGGNITPIITSGIGIPLHLDIDPVNEKIYWSELGVIRRANLNGSNVEMIFSTTSSTPNGLALDTNAGKVYWTLPSENKIQRSNLDGSTVEDVYTAAAGPISVAIDGAGGKMYWSEEADSSQAVIRRSNLNGSAAQTLVTLDSNVIDASGLALDLTNQKLYWGESATDDTGKLWRSNLDGTSASAIVSSSLVEIQEIALDHAGGKVYWTQPDLATIQRSNLDGSSVETVVTLGSAGSAVPVGLAFLSAAAPSNVCDFTSDTQCNWMDIGMMFNQGDLVAGVAVGAGNVYDLNSDSSIDNQDISEWLSNASTKNGFATPYRRGDTELDRDVDITDFNVLAVNFSPTGAVPSPAFHQGNFDGDNDVDITDFNALATNFAPSGYGGQAQSVPEPTALALAAFGCLLGWGLLSRRQTSL